jgi:uncharacterized protein YkwD
MKRFKKIIHHLFLPSENNNYRAKALHLDFLTYYLLLAIVFSFSFKFASLSRNILGIATDITKEKLFQLTNDQRVKNGLKALSYNEQLAIAASEKAKNMFSKNYWAHYAPDGTTPWNFILSSGYKYEYAGENLAKDFMFSDGVVSAWMDSQTHRENILRPNYEEVGFAVVDGTLNGEETTLVVQMFGKPLQKTAAVEEFGPSGTAAVNAKPTTAPLANKQAPLLPQALANEKSQKPLINVSKFSYDYSLLFFLLLLLALISDLYFAYRLKIVRISGKHMAHFIFLGFVLILLVTATRGVIL